MVEKQIFGATTAPRDGLQDARMLASLFTAPQPKKSCGGGGAAVQQHAPRGIAEQVAGGGDDTSSATQPAAGFAFKFAFQ